MAIWRTSRETYYQLTRLLARSTAKAPLIFLMGTFATLGRRFFTPLATLGLSAIALRLILF